MLGEERRRAILECLCIRRQDTRENLAREFGISIRTIDRDLLTLSLAYPIYTKQGNGGGIHIEDGYYPNRSGLNEAEKELLGKLLHSLSGEDRRTLRGLIDRKGWTVNEKRG